MFIPGQLLDNWFPDLGDDKQAGFLWQSAQIVLFSLGGFIALVGVGLSLSRHREELGSARRDQENDIRSRFISAVEMMGDTAAPIRRTAGLFAVATVADIWISRNNQREAQVCINVLCAYLSSPYNGLEGPEREAEREVRTTGFTIIRNRLLSSNSEQSWNGFDFNFSRAYINYPVNLSGICCSQDTRISFDSVQIGDGGSIILRDASIVDASRITLSSARLYRKSEVDCVGISLSGEARLLFANTRLESSIVNARGITASGKSIVSVSQLRAAGDSSFVLNGLKAQGAAELRASGISLTNSKLDICKAKFDDSSQLFAPKARLGSKARLRVDDSCFSGSSVVNFDSIKCSSDTTFSITRTLIRGDASMSVKQIDSASSSRCWIGPRLSGSSCSELSFQDPVDGIVRLDKLEISGEATLRLVDCYINDDNLVTLRGKSLDDEEVKVLGRVFKEGGTVECS